MQLLVETSKAGHAENRLRAYIAEGGYKAGDRLPPEGEAPMLSGTAGHKA